MNNLKEFAQRIGSMPSNGRTRDGLIAVMVVHTDARVESWPPSVEDGSAVMDLMCTAAELGLKIPATVIHKNVIVNLGSSGQKMRVEFFDHVTVVVTYEKAHKVKKSIERVIRMSARRYGYEPRKVEPVGDEFQHDPLSSFIIT